MNVSEAKKVLENIFFLVKKKWKVFFSFSNQYDFLFLIFLTVVNFSRISTFFSSNLIGAASRF